MGLVLCVAAVRFPCLGFFPLWSGPVAVFQDERLYLIQDSVAAVASL